MSNTSTKLTIALVLCGIVVTNPHSYQEETYLLNCQRYIELNPVRASMVEYPALYRWSSYRFNGLGEANQYVSPHPVYLWKKQQSPIKIKSL